VSARRPLPWIYPLQEIHGLDSGIEGAVRVLREEGVRTAESCEGGPGHAFTKPTACFAGGFEDGFRALAAVMHPAARRRIVMRLSALRYVWTITDDREPTGPEWELVCEPRPSDTPCRECGQYRTRPECADTQSAFRQGNSPCCDTALDLPPRSCDMAGSPPEPQLPHRSQHSCQDTSCSPREDDGIAPDPSQVIP
jgi:hypothetical protein